MLSEDFERLIEHSDQMPIEQLFEYIKNGYMTHEQLERLGHIYVCRSMSEFINVDRGTNMQLAEEGHTDVLFFGLPGSGKSCILSGIVGANGDGYKLQMNNNMGDFTSMFSAMVDKGLLPLRTPNDVTPIIEGKVLKRKKKSLREFSVNFVEISSYLFCRNVFSNEERVLERMDFGPRNLFRNSNRKIIFLVIDPTLIHHRGYYFPRIRTVKIEGREEVVSDFFDAGNGDNAQHIAFSQFIDIIGKQENGKILQNIDAIHFIVTKIDSLECEDDVKEVEYNLWELKEKIFHLCIANGINNTTVYRPSVLTFSLGTFYTDWLYDFNSHDTLKLIDIIKTIIIERKKGWKRIAQDFFKFVE